VFKPLPLHGSGSESEHGRPLDGPPDPFAHLGRVGTRQAVTQFKSLHVPASSNELIDHGFDTGVAWVFDIIEGESPSSQTLPIPSFLCKHDVLPSPTKLLDGTISQDSHTTAELTSRVEDQSSAALQVPLNSLSSRNNTRKVSFRALHLSLRNNTSLHVRVDRFAVIAAGISNHVLDSSQKFHVSLCNSIQIDCLCCKLSLWIPLSAPDSNIFPKLINGHPLGIIRALSRPMIA